MMTYTYKFYRTKRTSIIGAFEVVEDFETPAGVFSQFMYVLYLL